MSTYATNPSRELPVGQQKSYFFDGFIISPLNYGEVSIYTCDARSYGKDDFNTRRDISRRIERQVGDLKTAIMKKYIVTNKPIGQIIEEKNFLNRIKQPPDYLLMEATKTDL